MAMIKIQDDSTVLIRDKTIFTTDTIELSSDLVAFYAFDDLTDSSGNGQTLAASGGSSVTFSSGKVGDAATFDGSNYVRATYSLSGDFSYSGWIRLPLTPVSGDNTVLFLASAGPHMLYRPYLSKFRFTLNNSTEYYSANTFAPNAWYHAVFTTDSVNGSKMYINNVLEATGPYLASAFNGNINLMFGNWLVGQLDSVGLWSRALNVREISNLYNSGNGYEI